MHATTDKRGWDLCFWLRKQFREGCAVGDAEMSELAKEEIEELSKEAAKLEQELKILLLPKDPLDERNIMLEVITLVFCSLSRSPSGVGAVRIVCPFTKAICR